MKIISRSMYPQWLGKYILGEIEHPQPKGQPTTIQAFRENYPLHDSGLLFLSFVPGTIGMVSAIFRWEIRSIEEKLLPNPPLFLEILFTRTYQLRMGIRNANATNIIDHIESLQISEEGKKGILDNSLLLPLYQGQEAINEYFSQDLQHTIIQDIHGNQINLYHDEEIEVLCLNAEGEIIQLSEL